jgi:hypothetical protein
MHHIYIMIIKNMGYAPGLPWAGAGSVASVTDGSWNSVTSSPNIHGTGPLYRGVVPPA